MAINSVVLDIRSDVNAHFTAPASVMCNWHQVGEEDYLSELDVSPGEPITNPDAQITLASRQILRRDNRMGTLLGLRMAYNSGLTNIVSPVVKVFGRAENDSWQILKSRVGALSVPLTVASTDISKVTGTTFYTTPDPDGHYWDTQGCTEFLVGVEVALSATGTITIARLEAKII